MEKVWEDDSPHAKFWRQLLNNRVDELVNTQDWLKRLRYRHDEVKWWNKRCGHIFEERGLNLYQLIAQSHGECWDEEDEQKCAPAYAGSRRSTSERSEQAAEENVAPPMLKEKPRHNALRVDHPRKIGVRLGKEEELELHVRPGDEGREKDLQAGREELYRRAGGRT